MKRIILLWLLLNMVTSSMAASINWPEALKGVAAGEQAWLDQTPELAMVADVKQSQELEAALSSALSTNTVGALKMLSVLDSRDWPHFVGTDLVCMGPVNKQQHEIEDFYHQTRLALLSTDKGALCLWILEATYEEWKADNARRGPPFSTTPY